jgi:YVTN family beta-propeller protein
MKPSLENAGQVFLYFQPFTREAERLRFTLDRISAIKDDGQEIPLSLSFQELSAPDMKRQRLLASGQLPPGMYSGLSFHVRDAALKTEKEEASLLVPERPVRVDFSFRVDKKKAYLFSSALNYSESISNVAFTPAFQVFVPARPLSGITGYITDYRTDTVTVFDKKRMEAAGAIVTGSGPRAVVIDPTSFKAYVAISDEDSVEVIDLLSGYTIDSIRLSPGDDTRELALTPDGRLLLALNFGRATVSIIDTSRLVELRRITVGNGPRSLLVDNTGRRAYVFNSYSGTMSVIDIARMETATTVRMESNPVRGQFNRRGDRLYVIFSGTPYLSVLDVATLSVLRKAFVGIGSETMKVDTKTDFLYIGKRGSEGVAVYDPFTFSPVSSIRTQGVVAFMAIDNEEDNLYLVIPERRVVAIVNLISRKLVGEIDVAEDPYWVAMTRER